jgi:hypothetical protein
MLRELSYYVETVCICAGTSNGRILDVSGLSKGLLYAPRKTWMINFAFLKLKDSDSQAPLLLCVYLGSHDKEFKHIAKNVAFVNASGCCNGLALDKFAETYTIERNP